MADEKVKELIIEYNGENFERIPVKTKVVIKGDDIAEVAAEYTQGLLVAGDVLFISEKSVACSQGRSFSCLTYPSLHSPVNPAQVRRTDAPSRPDGECVVYIQLL